MKTYRKLLKAQRYGVRDYKAHLSEYVQKPGFQIITLHGEPKKVVLDYEEMLEFLDVMEEMSDPALIDHIQKARKSYKKNPDKAIDALKSLNTL